MKTKTKMALGSLTLILLTICTVYAALTITSSPYVVIVNDPPTLTISSVTPDPVYKGETVDFTLTAHLSPAESGVTVNFYVSTDGGINWSFIADAVTGGSGNAVLPYHTTVGTLIAFKASTSVSS